MSLILGIIYKYIAYIYTQVTDRRESHQMTSMLQPLQRHVEWRNIRPHW